VPIQVAPAKPAVNPLADAGYAAFQRGDLAGARNSYEQLLARDPSNRDALLGLAAVDVRGGDYELAQSRYLRMLDLNPRDGLAQAGLAALYGQVDPVATESRLKTLIAEQPDVADLYFALGNQLAAQSRWPEAQEAYFKAVALDGANPDYAFNLAVSLDQMRKPRQALDYYRRALALAGSRSAAFNAAAAQARVKELGAFAPSP
jgi:tetratricopeptide (TPR) repeat protein